MSKVVRQIKKVVDENFLKDTKRAVIFQGGGAIGAYAAGVYAAYITGRRRILQGTRMSLICCGSILQVPSTLQ